MAHGPNTQSMNKSRFNLPIFRVAESEILKDSNLFADKCTEVGEEHWKPSARHHES